MNSYISNSDLSAILKGIRQHPWILQSFWTLSYMLTLINANSLSLALTVVL